jgi:hypothetical protein
VWWMCGRFCRMEVETPEYALLACDASTDTIALRSIFLKQLIICVPALRWTRQDWVL